ncbi:hypothetical protein CO074_01165, partial [bacterium (Candidatus Moisslbacteria) CG_4_9_14_0_8_um_filter_36_20]
SFSKGLTLIILILLVLPNLCLSQGEIQQGLKNVGEQSGLPGGESGAMYTIVGKVVGIVVGLLGLILAVFIVYGGAMWMTSGGNEEQIKKAKGMIVNAIIGLVIVLLAYAISSFIIDKLAGAVATMPK